MPEIYSRRAFLKIAIGSALTFSQQACGGETAPISPTADKIATSKPETPTLTPTPTNTPEPTPTPTETAFPEPEGSRGNVKSIEDLKIPDAQKEAIRIMLKGSTPQIIVQDEETGQVVIIAIDDDFLSTLHSVKLNTSKFPDADKRLAGLVLEAKYQAYKHKSKSDISLEDYKKKGGSFLYHAEDVISAEDVSKRIYGNYEVGKDSPYVMVLTGDPSDNSDQVELAKGFMLGTQFGNGVVGQRYYQAEPGIGIYREDQIQLWEYQFSLNFIGSLLQLMDTTALKIQGKGFSNFNHPEFADIINVKLLPYAFDINPDTGIVREKTHFPSIFITSGTLVDK